MGRNDVGARVTGQSGNKELLACHTTTVASLYVKATTYSFNIDCTAVYLEPDIAGSRREAINMRRMTETRQMHKRLPHLPALVSGSP